MCTFRRYKTTQENARFIKKFSEDTIIVHLNGLTGMKMSCTTCQPLFYKACHPLFFCTPAVWLPSFCRRQLPLSITAAHCRCQLPPPVAAVCLFNFPALGNDSNSFGYGCLFSRALTTVACFSALGQRLLVFLRFDSGCLSFRTLATVAVFPAPWQGLLVFPRSNIFFSNFLLRSWLIGL